MAAYIRNLIRHLRKKVTSDGMGAMLGVGTMYTEARETETLQRRQSHVVDMAFSANGDTYHDIIQILNGGESTIQFTGRRKAIMDEAKPSPLSLFFVP